MYFDFYESIIPYKVTKYSSTLDNKPVGVSVGVVVVGNVVGFDAAEEEYRGDVILGVVPGPRGGHTSGDLFHDERSYPWTSV